MKFLCGDHFCIVSVSGDFLADFCLPVCFASHLQGMFNRTIKLLEFGVKPVYVFDGKPPEMKSGTVRPFGKLVCHLIRDFTKKRFPLSAC